MLSEVLTKEHASTYVSFLDFVMKFLDLLSYIAFGGNMLWGGGPTYGN